MARPLVHLQSSIALLSLFFVSKTAMNGGKVQSKVKCVSKTLPAVHLSLTIDPSGCHPAFYLRTLFPCSFVSWLSRSSGTCGSSPPARCGILTFAQAAGSFSSAGKFLADVVF